MKKIKTQNGITLIALIITIVVLLILAGVAIGTLQESNIIGQATDAASKFNQSKQDELDALLEYEEYFKEPKEYTVYGTEEFYVIISPEDDIIVVRDGVTINNSKMTKKTKEVYLSGLSEEEAANIRADIESLENETGDTIQHFIFVEGMNDGFPIGAFIGGKVFVGDGFLEKNTNLASSVVRKKGTYQCFGIIEDEGAAVWDVNYNNNTCTCFLDLPSLNMAGPLKYTKNSVTQNEEEITVYVNGEKVVIGTNAKKVETQFEGEEGILVYYIQDSILYMDDERSSLKDGDTDGMAVPLVEYDLSKFGIIVVE